MNLRKGIRVAVNRYGVIGKRVADTVAEQDDTNRPYPIRGRATGPQYRKGAIAKTNAALGIASWRW